MFPPPSASPSSPIRYPFTAIKNRYYLLIPSRRFWHSPLFHQSAGLAGGKRLACGEGYLPTVPATIIAMPSRTPSPPSFDPDRHRCARLVHASTRAGIVQPRRRAGRRVAPTHGFTTTDRLLPRHLTTCRDHQDSMAASERTGAVEHTSSRHPRRKRARQNTRE